MTALTNFERAVMEKLLEGEDEVLSILREQLEVIVVDKRELTGVGFYTTFSVPENARCLRARPSFKFGDVIAKIPELNHGAGFLLYVEGGALHMLEGYTYDEPWPQLVHSFGLSYVSGGQRDMKALRDILSQGCEPIGNSDAFRR